MASTIKVDNVQNQPGTNIIDKCGTTITLGQSGDTVSLASGASQTGFGRTGTVDWDTGSIKTTTFTAVSGNGYFVNTTGGGITVNLPAGSAGDIVGLKDYANTWDNNAVTLNPNGSDKIGGGADTDPTLEAEGGSVLLVYVDTTQGWLATEQSVTASPSGIENFIVASGGNSCGTTGNYKWHKFTSPGTFTVSSLATAPANDEVSYLVVAGGGGASGMDNFSSTGGGGGAAGGYRESKSPADCYTASPIEGSAAVTVSATPYPITVGGGGAGGGTNAVNGTVGSNSIFSTITSAGGGYGGASGNTGGSGGSGGGGGATGGSAGTGNSPPVSPPQGQNGSGAAPTQAGGGGGAGGASSSGVNGVGTTTQISGSAVLYSEGGGGGNYGASSSPGHSAGSGGNSGYGPFPSPNNPGQPGTANTGGGAGGGTTSNTAGPRGTGGAGGSGIVIIRYKYQ